MIENGLTKDKQTNIVIKTSPNLINVTTYKVLIKSREGGLPLSLDKRDKKNYSIIVTFIRSSPFGEIFILPLSKASPSLRVGIFIAMSTTQLGAVTLEEVAQIKELISLLLSDYKLNNQEATQTACIIFKLKKERVV
jgi:hypothetical protein